jgi:hypothetical protein
LSPLFDLMSFYHCSSVGKLTRELNRNEIDPKMSKLKFEEIELCLLWPASGFYRFTTQAKIKSVDAGPFSDDSGADQANRGTQIVVDNMSVGGSLAETCKIGA